MAELKKTERNVDVLIFRAVDTEPKRLILRSFPRLNNVKYFINRKQYVQKSDYRNKYSMILSTSVFSYKFRRLSESSSNCLSVNLKNRRLIPHKGNHIKDQNRSINVIGPISPGNKILAMGIRPIKNQRKISEILFREKIGLTKMVGD